MKQINTGEKVEWFHSVIPKGSRWAISTIFYSWQYCNLAMRDKGSTLMFKNKNTQSSS